MSARKPRPSVPEPILVLDLGTAALRVALVVEGRPEVIPFPSTHGGDGGDRVPTVVGFDTSRIHSAQDRLVLGDAARRLLISEPRTQLTGALRLAGRRHELVPLDGDHWRSVPVVRGPGADVHARLAGESWPMPRLLGALIQSLVDRLVRERGLAFERAVVSIAPGSDDARRRAVVHALRIAGFSQIELVHGTSAAALAWSTLERAGTSGLGIAGLEAALAGASKLVALADDDEDGSLDSEEDDDEDEDDDDAAEAGTAESNATSGADSSDVEENEDADEPEPEKPREQLVLLLDLGAGSFDAALARFDGADIEVLASRSRFDLAGDEIDERIVDWLLGQFEDANEVDLAGDPTVRARMRDVAEKAKIALGDADRYEVRLPFLWADASGPKHLFVTLERERLERMIRDVVDAVAALASAVLDDAEQSTDALDAVVMIGGCSRVPILQDRIEQLLGRVPETELSVAALDDDFVVRGLALEAARRGRRRPLSALADIAGRELWLRTSSGASRVIERRGVRPVQRTIPLKLEGEGPGRRAEFELLEGNDDDRARTLCARVSGDVGTAKLRLSIDADGCIAVQADPPSVELVVSQRVGLSARALERLRREAGERARAAAAQHRNEELRRRVWTLTRTVEAWLGESHDGPAIDELLRTSLTQWRRDAEVALEHGAEEILRAGLDSFVTLRDALPAKLRAQVEEEAGELQVGGEDEAAQAEPLGAPSDDYDAHELVELLEDIELEAAHEEEDGEVEEAEEEAEEEEEEAEVEEAEVEETEEEEEDEEGAEEASAEVEAEAEEEEKAEEEEEAEEEEAEEAEAVEAEAEEAEETEAETEETEAVEAEAEEASEPAAEAEEPNAEAEEPESEEASEPAAEEAEEPAAEEASEPAAEEAEQPAAEAEEPNAEVEPAAEVAEEPNAEAEEAEQPAAEAEEPNAKTEEAEDAADPDPELAPAEAESTPEPTAEDEPDDKVSESESAAE